MFKEVIYMKIDLQYIEGGSDIKADISITYDFSDESREGLIFEAIKLQGYIQISSKKYLNIAFFNYINFKEFFKKISDFF